MIDLPSCMYSMKSVYGSSAKNACDTIDGTVFSAAADVSLKTSMKHPNGPVEISHQIDCVLKV